MVTITQVSQVMHTLLTVEADRIGRETGCIRRAVKLTGSSLVQTLVFGALGNPVLTYTDLSQAAASLGVPISPQGLEQRFTQTASTFLQAVLAAAVEQLVCASPVALPILHRFRGVYIEDSSTIPLPQGLHALWPGAGGSAGQTAGLKFQVRFDYLSGQVQGPVLQAAARHDRACPLQAEPLPAGGLRLEDLGFFSLDKFARDQQEGVYWISRLKAGTVVYTPTGERLDLLAWLGRQPAAQVDRPIGLGKQHRLPCRLVGVKVPQEVADQRRRRLREYARKKQVPVAATTLALAAWTLGVTNLPPEQASLPEALLLLGVRWQVECLFRLWKDQAKIDEWRSQNPWRILCEVYAKLIGCLITHWVGLISLWTYPNRSLTKASQLVRKFALCLAIALATPTQLESLLAVLQRCLASTCQQNTRKTHPGTWQQLLTVDSGGLP